MPDTLTAVEQQVARCALNRLSYEQTAHRLNLPETTVQDSLHSIYDKLGINSQLELLLCVCSGLVKIARSEGAMS
ncbi:MAG TPA: LuxR C-terminal-related transcriptional regulator [Terriglobales bacterium]|nr:LuxR C-terminal-related transcriptional regulator [Terriglobales bacterium]